MILVIESYEKKRLIMEIRRDFTIDRISVIVFYTHI